MGKDLVVLADRVPFPPVGGDRVRIFNICRFFSSRGVRVHLVCFARSRAELDAASGRPERKIFESLRVVPFNRTAAALQAAMGVFSRRSMQADYHRDRRMAEALQAALRAAPGATVLCHLIRTAPYALRLKRVRRVLEMTDVFSDYYRRASRLVGRRGFLVYSVEEPRVRRLERECLEAFDAVVVVSERERAVLGGGPKVHAIPNGVREELLGQRSEAFDPDLVTFHGHLGYPPNRDAALHFGRDVFPGLRKEIPSLKFRLVGLEPGRELEALARRHGYEMTGYVEDVTPHIRGALASVCPLRASTGIQNKVLEAMALGVPVLTTAKGLLGIPARDEVIVVEDDWLTPIRRLRGDPAFRTRLADAAQGFIRERFLWPSVLRPYEALV